MRRCKDCAVRPSCGISSKDECRGMVKSSDYNEMIRDAILWTYMKTKQPLNLDQYSIYVYTYDFTRYQKYVTTGTRLIRV